MKYRAEIDGLRALAVVPVILFHAGFELFSGGFVGVDVFFVISGYLITTILIEDIENQHFSIVNFYERRARRILPALFFVMLVCIPFAWIWMLPSQLKDFSQSLVAVSLFASNILFWRESGYFDAAAEEKPMLHTWSLAVEEQYYVLFPIFLISAWRFGKNRVFWMIVVMAGISLLLSEWGWRNKATANFYLAPTRVWEIFAGSIAAFIIQKKGVQKNNALALIGLAAIVFSIFFYDETTPIPSVYALVPVLGVVLYVLYANKETLAAKLLSNKVLVGIGLISYSSYLWHQPLFAFARIRSPEHPSLLLMLALCLLSILLAYFSWRYVEKPFRNKKKLAQLTLVKFSFLGLFLYILVGLSGHFFSAKITKIRFIEGGKFTQTYMLLEEAKNASPVFILENRYDNEDCRFSAVNLNDLVEERINQCYEKYGAGILIFGDSHATSLYHSLVGNVENDDILFLMGITKNGCHLPTDDTGCQYGELLRFLQVNPGKLETLIYEKAGYLMLNFYPTRDNLRSLNATMATIKHQTIRGVSDYLLKLAKHSNVIWFGPRIEPLVDEKELYHRTCNFKYLPNDVHIKSYTQLDDYIIKNLTDSEISYISQNASYQFTFPRDFGSCDGLYWMDRNHFSRLGEIEFGNRFNLIRQVKRSK